MEFKFRHLKAILRRYKIKVDKSIGLPAGFGLVGPHHVTGIEQIHIIPAWTNHAEVEKEYVNAIRRRFGLLPENGIDDRIFFGS